MFRSSATNAIAGGEYTDLESVMEAGATYRVAGLPGTAANIISGENQPSLTPLIASVIMPKPIDCCAKVIIAGGATNSAKVAIDGSGDRPFERSFRSYPRRNFEPGCKRRLDLEGVQRSVFTSNLFPRGIAHTLLHVATYCRRSRLPTFAASHSGYTKKDNKVIYIGQLMAENLVTPD